MAYDRNGAVTYAGNFWNIPADDGLFWLSNQAVKIDEVRLHNVLRAPYWQKAPVAEGWQPMFADDGNHGEKAVFRRVNKGVVEEILINPWEGIADCAHFLSRCLTAGGLKIGEISVPDMIAKLKDRHLHPTKVLCEQVPTEAGQRVIDSGIFKPGDMIGYFNIDPHGDYGGKKQYTHSTMYVGKIGGKTDGGVACHTICRYPGRTQAGVEDSWWLYPPKKKVYTLIHVASDDPPPNAARAQALVGWWRLDYAGKTEYYLVQKDGTAQYTLKAPHKGQTQATAPAGSAYWFMDPGGAITFIWRKTGTVEVWTPAGFGYKSMINQATPGTLTKL